MIVSLGADHGGFRLKNQLLEEIRAAGHQVLDCGTHDESPCDYPDITRAVAQSILAAKAERGLLVCGSGVGAAMAANKIQGIRAALCHDCYSARQAVEHDDAQILCLGARVIGTALASELVRVFLAARFSEEERHVRRLRKIAEWESGTSGEPANDS